MQFGGRISNEVLVKAGLDIMSQHGKALTKLPSKGRAMLYKMNNGDTVRMRTCNDHILIVVADRPTLDAKLNIEGTDWLLIVMPEIERRQGKIIAYLVPTKVAVHEARHSHEEWLKLNPRTKGDNRTWNLWFQTNGPDKANNYAEKWSKYLLRPHASATNLAAFDGPAADSSPMNVKKEVENARQRIARAADLPVEAVRISIDFGG